MPNRFRELVEQNLGCAVILAGSDSDKEHIRRITGALTSFMVPHEVRIESAHNSPINVLGMIAEYDIMQGSLAYITVAGGTDALSGIVARHTFRPVISCPPDAPNESCLRNPPLSSNLYVARPENAARAVAQMFSFLNPDYKQRILQGVEDKGKKLCEVDEKLRRELSWYLEVRNE